MQWPFFQVNVFSLDPLKGNPLAVVRLDSPLPPERMQDVARWTNLSETVFLERSNVADYKARIFTSQQEIPFAGHPSIGALFAALAWGLCPPGRARYLQECLAGQVELKALGPSDYMVRMPEPSFPPLKPNHQKLASLLLKREASEALVVDLGPKWLVLPVSSANALYDEAPAISEITALSLELSVTGLTLFWQDPETGQVELRSFAPTSGVDEDPVCGSGIGAVAAYLHQMNRLDERRAYKAVQGKALERQGEANVEFTEGGIWVGGRVQVVIDGKIEGL